MVVQHNKRDLNDVLDEKELVEEAAKKHAQIYPAVALRGEGVVETFFGLLDLIWDSLDQRFGFSKKFAVSRSDFMAQLANHLADGSIASPVRPLGERPVLGPAR
jgi:hypothetical protein